MQTVTTIGFDIAKSVFQVHGVDAAGEVVIRRQLKRRFVLAFFQKLPPCLVGIEACASSHYWSRELQALGHTVRASRRSNHGLQGHDAVARCRGARLRRRATIPHSRF
jgi:transposase